ncbi:SIS domain-containing protein [Anaerococcus sp. Marseille-P3625]|uniref:SIS domain-containing protein n=1 Tax=Anaerococcus sp. Marseille-P3625 TaxID=1977277 RepID=UPI000C06FCAB|nr:SIS domain-containing protein [Anaerococcus sp. Marseille-P3625]
MNFLYINRIKQILEEITKYETYAMDAAVCEIKKAILNKNNIYVFGSSHAGILSQELYYRAGGLMVINPIFPRETMLDTSPITRTSKMERLEGYGKIIAEEIGFLKDDILIVHSVSGRNPQTIDMAIEAKSKGAKVICITNINYSKSVNSRHSSGKKLFEVSDIILDNHGDVGDASVFIEKLDMKVTATSSITSIYIAQEILTQAIYELANENFLDIPIFYSANIDGGDDKNKELFSKYKNNIRYKLY